MKYIRALVDLLWPQTYRTPAELPPDLWKSHLHQMQLDYSNRFLRKI